VGGGTSPPLQLQRAKRKGAKIRREEGEVMIKMHHNYN